MLEIMLRLDEGKNAHSDPPEPSTPTRSPLSQHGSPGPSVEGQVAQLKAAISLLHVFSCANPSLLVPHMDVIYPYLKGENNLANEDEREVCQMVCGIVTQVRAALLLELV